MGYVRKQKTHHSENDLWPDYEESIEEVATADVPLLPAAWQAVSDSWVAEVAQIEG